MKIHQLYDDINFDSLRKDIQSYSWLSFKQDLLAGLSVAMITVPQAMAYSLVAGLPLFCGLFAAIFSSMITSALGSSRHLVCGPGNAIAIMIQAGIAEILYTYYRDVAGPERDILIIHIISQLSLLIGVFQILGAVCKLGRLTQFVSHSVVIGYSAGVSLAIMVGQFFNFSGIKVPLEVTSLFERSLYIVSHLGDIHWPTLGVGLGSLFLFYTLREIDRRLPAAVMMLAITGGIVYTVNFFFPDTGFDQEMLRGRVPIVGDTGNLNAFPPQFALPYFHLGIMNKLLPVAFAIALLSIMETTSSVKSIAAISGQRLSINQEIFGLGMGNLFSSFLSAMPISGSLSRSNMLYQNGGRTRFAAIFNSLFVLLIVLGFGFFVSRIPLASLAALLLASAAGIINRQHLLICFKATSSDAFVLFITILSCVFFSFDIAFYIGIALSITLFLKKSAVPQVVEFAFDEQGTLHTIANNSKGTHKPIRLIKVEGELFFGAADLFQTTLKTIAEDDTSTRVIILQLKNARDIDATACLALKQLYEYLKSSGRYLIGCGITHQVWDVLSSSGIVQLVGKENLFIFDERHPQKSAQRALQRAKELLERKPLEMAEYEVVEPTILPINAEVLQVKTLE